jgi:hypothetical protein
MPKQPLHFRSGSTGLPRRLRRGEAAKRITKPADLMRKAPPKRGFNCPHACRRYSPHSHNVEPWASVRQTGSLETVQARRLHHGRDLGLLVAGRLQGAARALCNQTARRPVDPPARLASANRCCVGLSTHKPTERVGVERWVCHLPGKPDRSNLALLRRGFFFGGT